MLYNNFYLLLPFRVIFHKNISNFVLSFYLLNFFIYSPKRIFTIKPISENTDRVLHATQRLDEASRGLLDTVDFPVAALDHYQSGVQLKALSDGHLHIELLAEHFDHGAVDIRQRLGSVDHRQLKAEVERHQTLKISNWECNFAL